MASTDARPFPLKNTAYRVTFPILDADGDLVAGATGLDSEVSKDGGTFTDCTNEATQIATSSGVYYLDLTATEMNADTVAIIVKTTSTDAKTTVIVLYPVEGGDIDVDVTYINGAAVSTSTAQLGVNAVQAGGTAWGSGAITAASIASDAITAAKIADNAIDAAALAADAGAEIADAVWDEALAGHATAGTAGKKLSDAGDPWATALPGAYAAGTAGKILGDKAFNASQIGGSATAATNAARGFQGLVLGKAVTGTLTTTVFTTSLTEATNDHYNGRSLTFTSGALAGQQTTITDYDGATKRVTVAAMTEAPANNDEFYIA